MEIKDFLPFYPFQEHGGIQRFISSCVEFIELRPGENLFAHQEMGVRFMRQYNRLFNIQATGTGKSKFFINIAEYFRKNDEGIKCAFVLEPGNSTKENFKNEIIKQTDIESDRLKIISEAVSDKERRNLITRTTGKWYNIYGYQEFTNWVRKLTNDEIIEIFSDSIFFLDEVHRKRNDEVGNSEDLFSGMTNKDSPYTLIWNVLHTAKRAKIVIATATPLVNNPNDFVPLINLLLPKSYQMPNIDYRFASLKQLAPFFHGMFSYIRNADEGVEIINMGEKMLDYDYEIEIGEDEQNTVRIPFATKQIEDGVLVEKTPKPKIKFHTKKIYVKSSINVVKLEMSQHQTDAYLKHLEKGDITLRTKERQISLSTFLPLPGKPYPFTKDDAKNVYTLVRKNNTVFCEFNSEYRKRMLDGNLLENIKIVSASYHFLCKNELEKTGKAFAYCEFLNGIGLYHLSLLLELLGFKQYRVGNIKLSPDGKNYNIYNMTKEKRFALLSHGTNTDNILNLFNSPDNLEGEYLQLLIGTDVAKEGINMMNTLRGYILTPLWNDSGMEQAMARILRASSHKQLREKRGKISVEIYKLASIPRNSKVEPVDIYLYKLSERKDIENRLMFRKMKIFAYDALLNYDRNVRSSDIEFTKETDYSEKYFKPINSLVEPNQENRDRGEWAAGQYPPRDEWTMENWRLFYSELKVKKLREQILKILSENKSITLDELVRLTKTNSLQYILCRALRYLIEKESYILDDYGNRLYVKIFKNSIYLTKDFLFNENSDYIPSITEAPVFMKQKTYYYNEVQETLTEEVAKKFGKDTEKNRQIIKELEGGYYEILEYAIINNKKEIAELFYPFVAEIFKHQKFLDKANFMLNEKRVLGRGRKAEVGSYLRLRDAFPIYDKMEKEKETEKVVIHFFPYTIKGSKGYGTFEQFTRIDKKLRILENGAFRDATKEEMNVYNWVILRDIIEPMFKNLDDKGIWASYSLHEDKFRLHNFIERSKGIDCKSIPLEDIKDIYTRIYGTNIDLNNKVEYCNLIRTRLENDKKVFVFV